MSKNDYLQLVEETLEQGGDIHAVNDEGYTPLMHEQEIKTHAKEILDLLCHQPESDKSIALAKECITFIADVNEPCEEELRNTYLIYCGIYNKPRIAGLLIDHGASLELEAKNRTTALERAVTYKNTEVVEVLLNRGADISRNGLSYLCSAIKNRHLAIAKLLLDKGVAPNAVDRGNTPLLDAIQFKAPRLVELLLQHKADPNLKGDDTYPLVMAIKNGDVEIIHQLLLHGADQTIKDGKKTIAAIANASKKPGVAAVCALTPAELKKYKPKKEGLVFTNKRMLFAMGVDQWSDVIKAQVKKAFGKMTIDNVREEVEEGDIEYVDVLNSESGKGMYQLITYPSGDGELFAWDKPTLVGGIVQHRFEIVKPMKPEARSQLHNMLDEANKAYGGVDQGVRFSE